MVNEEIKKDHEVNNNNIMLIGFMGAGKSTVASYISKMLSMEIVEMDATITAQEGMTVQEIFAKHGEEYFRNCESNLLIALQKCEKMVVSCGGGVPMRDKNVPLLKDCGTVVLLSATAEAILKRVQHSTERPLLNGNMNVEYIENLMEKRREKYLAAADVCIDTTNKSIHEVFEEIFQKVCH